ncbi:hypothetical protein Taro_051818 [Colocasia esculenta]|uniref:Uncharacterized protein n=1 Tax=Colocasia esculenta TaxID=4460 RepID=A0A843XI00_COLES|nr:hypothetical protein [Colocasia esculenta]
MAIAQIAQSIAIAQRLLPHVVDSAGSAGVVFGLTRAVVEAFTLFPLLCRYNQLVDHVGIHGQRRLTEALNKDSLVR